MTLFETETMAELCAKQGQIAEALAIYRRLVADAPDELTRARRRARLSELERRTTAATLTMPAAPAGTAEPAEPKLALERRGDALAFRWTLPDGTHAAALQIFLVTRGAAGIETETRTVRVEAARGAATIEVARLVSVRAALGRVEDGRFVPLARLPDGTPETL